MKLLIGQNPIGWNFHLLISFVKFHPKLYLLLPYFDLRDYFWKAPISKLNCYVNKQTSKRHLNVILSHWFQENHDFQKITRPESGANLICKVFVHSRPKSGAKSSWILLFHRSSRNGKKISWKPVCFHLYVKSLKSAKNSVVK